MSTRLRTRSVVMLLSLVMLVSESVSSVASPSGAASPLGLSAAAPSRIAGCALLPSSNVWNTPVSNLPVAANSAAVVAAIGAGSPLHPDFGSGTWAGSPIGIPYSVVPSTQAGVSVHFSYSSESDHGPYPVPAHPKIEGGRSGTGDRHVLLVQRGTCKDFELYDAWPVAHSTGWTAGSGAIFPLGSNALRPAGWTSADAAGLPILAGLVRPVDVARGAITHALRLTVPVSAASYVWPARHQAGSVTGIVPMGLRLRLKASVDLSSFPAPDLWGDRGRQWCAVVPLWGAERSMEQRHAPSAQQDHGLGLRSGRRIVPPGLGKLRGGEPGQLPTSLMVAAIRDLGRCASDPGR